MGMKTPKKSPKKTEKGLSATSEKANSMPAKLLLNKSEVCALVGMSWSKVRDLIIDGRFPKGIRLGHKTTKWRLSDVKEWIDGGCLSMRATNAKAKSKTA